MKHRRLLALLTSAAMLHLSVVAGDAACATHGTGGHHTTAARPTSMHDHEMATVDHAGDSVPSATAAAKPGAPPCEVPSQQHCCDAQAGCSVDSAAASGPTALVAAIVPAGRVHAAPDDAPASFASAPEPPPPKA
jgi:hypothetical protein